MRQIDPPSADASARGRGRSARLSGGLVALSSAAILAIYGAGYARTQSAPEQSSTPITLTARGVPTAVPTALPNREAAPPPGGALPYPSPTAMPVAAAATGPLRDGTYTGVGSSRHGSIQVAVVIRGGQITSAEITQCGTRYPCSKVDRLPGEVLARQSASVDVVSGATDSTTAYRGAVISALAQAH
jgi:uncharacterized protein with FMN-binding domain